MIILTSFYSSQGRCGTRALSPNTPHHTASGSEHSTRIPVLTWNRTKTRGQLAGRARQIRVTGTRAFSPARCSWHAASPPRPRPALDPHSPRLAPSTDFRQKGAKGARPTGGQEGTAATILPHSSSRRRKIKSCPQRLMQRCRGRAADFTSYSAAREPREDTADRPSLQKHSHYFGQE